jgi:hypothetical protein
MNMSTKRRPFDEKKFMTAAFALALCLAAALCQRYATPASAAAADCEGDACSQVTLTFDDAKQQYRAQNNSPDRWVHVSASNLAASAGACVEPGKSEYLSLKSLVMPYRATYADAGCGEQG